VADLKRAPSESAVAVVERFERGAEHQQRRVDRFQRASYFDQIAINALIHFVKFFKVFSLFFKCSEMVEKGSQTDFFLLSQISLTHQLFLFFQITTLII
jgi:hypothetical protein